MASNRTVENDKVDSGARYKTTPRVTPRLLMLLICLLAIFMLSAAGVILAWSPVDIDDRYIPLAAVIIAGGTAILLLAAIALRHMSEATRFLKVLTARVRRGLLARTFDLAAQDNRHDELGELSTALNELGSLYQESLQNLSQRAVELATIDLIVTTINRTLDLQEVLDTSLRETLRAVKLEVGALYMWDERSRTLNMVSYQGMSEDTVRKNISYRLGEGFIGKSADQRSIVMTYPGQTRGAEDWPSDDGWPETQISIPLVALPGQLLGTLNMGTSESRTLSENDMALLITVSAQIALAIDKAQLYTKASEHAVELENIVAARTDQLSQAIDELWIALKQAREADRIKSLLLSTVSHELRTPLATIKGSASLLIEHQSKIRAPQRLEHLQDIEDEADKLTELISSLLDMSRIEAGTLQISVHPFDLADVTTESMQKARVRLKDRTFTVRNAKTATMCSGDVRRVEQIIGNLIDNAAKYSSRGTQIDLELSRNDHEAILSVRDRGIGIDPEHLGHIFDRFYQVNMSSDSGRHGIGLGLAICKGLVEAQGGRIWAESKPKRGSTFSFSLPLHLTSP